MLLNISLTPNKNNNHSLELLSTTIGLVNIAFHMEAIKFGINYFIIFIILFFFLGIIGEVFIDNQDITNNYWLLQPGLLGEYLRAPFIN